MDKYNWCVEQIKKWEIEKGRTNQQAEEKAKEHCNARLMKKIDPKFN
ncbi:MAG: hypothetical protein WC934_02055 [Acidithiobacillus sp.]|jgi:hypothetical protein